MVAFAKPEKLLVKEPEAAWMLSICPKTLDEMRKRGEIACIRAGTKDRAKLYAVEDLRAWIAAKRLVDGETTADYAKADDNEAPHIQQSDSAGRGQLRQDPISHPQGSRD